MFDAVVAWLEDRLRLPREQIRTGIQWVLIATAAITFLLLATVIVAFDSIFISVNRIASLEEGDIAPRNIVAPATGGSFISAVRTEEIRESERDNVQPIYFPPDPEVARQQTQIAQQTLEFIDNVRASRYDTRDQRLLDLDRIITLTLDSDNANTLLQLDTDTWNAVQDEVVNVLSRVYRNEIRPGQVGNFITQLEIQVSSRFNLRERRVIVDIVDDLVLPNAFENVQATDEERERQAGAVESVTRSFVGGEIIVRENERIDALAYEALVALNLLQPDDLRLQQIVRAVLANSIMIVIAGIYLSRFSPGLIYNDLQQLALLAGTFLLMLLLVRFLGIGGNIYLFPAATLALLYVAIFGSHVAIIATLCLAFLSGLMANDSLQVAVIVAASGIMGTLGLQRAERLNQFFVAGAMVAVVNAAVVIIFNLISVSTPEQMNVVSLLGIAVFSGLLLVPASAIAAMYIISLLFNLTTALKLIDLSQPSKPLLQRLLREAPGTYQHSLQVANLAEQAANAIGADAQLTHVAALYHDIGKMTNPLYFTENQQDIGNPHDSLNDPYRSADIIISHATEGDEMARQYGLPQRIRDFIREHHGTTEVFVFYQRALQAVDGDEDAVDISDFAYPGPRPRSKETAILMLADSCEAAVRSVKPQSKQEISDLVTNIIEGKRKHRQLDKSNLTLNDLQTIRDIFVDILQSMFHPRINYREAVSPKKTDTSAKPVKPVVLPKAEPVPSNGTIRKEDTRPKKPTPAPQSPPPPVRQPERDKRVTDETEIADEEPVAEVPRLPSRDERRTTGTFRGIHNEEDAKPDAASEKAESDEPS